MAFTGMIDQLGQIVRLDKTAAAWQVWITSAYPDLALGESVAVDGACLTVCQIDGQMFCCDISPETAAVTIVAAYQPGTSVNLERALRVGDRLGGHQVSGHIDQTATVASIKRQGDFTLLAIEGITPVAQALLVPKGSVAVNGVSLTLNAISPGRFEVMLVPHTLTHTNLSQLVPGAAVNLEYDLIAKMVAQQARSYFN